MRKRMGRALLCAMIMVLVMLGSACAEFIFTDETPPIPREILEDPDDVLRLIDREHPLEKDYPDQSIAMYEMVPVSVRKTNRDFVIRGITNDALVALFDAAEAEGIKLYVDSAYRSYRNQEVSYYNRVKRIGHDDGVVQKEGASEHQAGLAADVVTAKYTERLLQEFGDTKEGIWLRDNCARFGFIIRYPADKEDITGVQYEPWHLRYVGVEVATYIMETGLSLEEFTEEWQQWTYD